METMNLIIVDGPTLKLNPTTKEKAYESFTEQANLVV